MGTISNDQTMAQAQMLNPGLMGGGGQQSAMGGAYPWLKGGADPISEALANARANAYQPPQLDNSQYQNAQAQIPIGMAIAQALASFSKDPSVADTVRKQGMQDMGMVNTLAQQDMQRQRAQAGLNMQSQQLNMAKENQAINIAKMKMDEIQKKAGAQMGAMAMEAYGQGGVDGVMSLFQDPKFKAMVGESGPQGFLYMMQWTKMAQTAKFNQDRLSIMRSNAGRAAKASQLTALLTAAKIQKIALDMANMTKDADPTVQDWSTSILKAMRDGDKESANNMLSNAPKNVTPKMMKYVQDKLQDITRMHQQLNLGRLRSLEADYGRLARDLSPLEAIERKTPAQKQAIKTIKGQMQALRPQIQHWRDKLGNVSGPPPPDRSGEDIPNETGGTGQWQQGSGFQFRRLE